MMSQTQSFAASFDSLPAVFEWVDRCSRELQVPREVSLKLRLVAEELFTNTVHHGFGGNSTASVTIILVRVANTVELTFEDTAPEYNPFAHLDTAAHKRSTAERPVGRLGIVLIDSFAERVHYERVEGRNRITVRLRDPEQL